MPKIKLLFLVLFIVVSTVKAQVSINLGVGKDFYTIPKVEDSQFELWDGTPAVFTREKISNPIYFNLQFEYKQNSIIYGFHVAGAYQKYHYYYNYFPLLHSDVTESEGDVPWARVEINADFLYEFVLGSGFSFIPGVSAGLQIMPPIVSEKFIYETTLNKILSLDFTDNVELEYLPNAKIIAKLKYYLTENFSLSAEANYLFIEKGKYDQPSSFFTSAIFLGITF